MSEKQDKEISRLASDYARLKKERAGQQIGLNGVRKTLNSKAKQLRDGRALLAGLGLRKIKPDKQDPAFKQLNLALRDFDKSDKAVRRSIERNIKKQGKAETYWIRARELKDRLFQLKNNKKSLSDRSQAEWEWVNSLKKNKFEPGCVAINLNEIKAFTHGLTRSQCTEHFIAYYAVISHAQAKSKFVFGSQTNFLSHFGFNNSYSQMSWKARQFELMNKIVKKLNALGFVYLKEVKRKIHKTGKVFYELVFKALNKFSKNLKSSERDKAVLLIKEKFIRKGFKPPPPFRLLDINFELSK